MAKANFQMQLNAQVPSSQVPNPHTHTHTPQDTDSVEYQARIETTGAARCRHWMVCRVTENALLIEKLF